MYFFLFEKMRPHYYRILINENVQPISEALANHMLTWGKELMATNVQCLMRHR